MEVNLDLNVKAFEAKAYSLRQILSDKEVVDLVEQNLDAIKAQVNELIEENMVIVDYVRSKYNNILAHDSAIDEDDIRQVDLKALCKAAQHFNPDAGVKFSTFASWCVHNAMKSLFRVLQNKVNTSTSESMDAPVGRGDDEGEGSTLHELLGGDYSVVGDVERNEHIAIAREAVKALSERQHFIIERVLAGKKGVEIAAELGVSRAYVNAETGRALEKMRDYILSKG